LKLSKTSAQAALALAYLAVQPADSTIRARQVASHLRIPTESALKILQQLAQRGLLKSRLGRTGGYRLGMPAEKITLRDVVEAIDGPVSAGFPQLNAADNLRGRLNLLRTVCETVAKGVCEKLQRTTVADLAKCGQMQDSARGG